MLGRATNNRTRIRVLMVVACLLAGPGAGPAGQVQFAGSAEDGGRGHRVRRCAVNPFRTPMKLGKSNSTRCRRRFLRRSRRRRCRAVSAAIGRFPGRRSMAAPRRCRPDAADYDLRHGSLPARMEWRCTGANSWTCRTEESLIEEPAAAVYSTNEWFRRGYLVQPAGYGGTAADGREERHDFGRSIRTSNGGPTESSASKTVTPTYAPGRG